MALVVQTLRRSGGFILGFRTEPPEVQQEMFDTLQHLHNVYTKDPVFGVRFSVEDTVRVDQNE
jgi:Bardet-Biedl syndrome 5 protein